MLLVQVRDGEFSVNPEASKFLKSLGNKEIVVASIAGDYRTGKSAILSRLLPKSAGGKSNVFNVGQTVNACTKGIHMSTTLLENPADPNTHILMLDTEGLGAPTAGRVHDTNIFVMTLLLSRVLMLNTKGTIDQKSLDTLRVVANIGNLLRATGPAPAAGVQAKRKKVDATEEQHANEEALAELFPALVWIVRDFALDLVDPEGQKITADQYLERAIVDVPGQDVEKNETRRALRKLFPKRTCITMCRPAADDEVLKNINSQPDSAIDPRFLEKIEELRRTIFMYSKRTGMTGSVLLSMAEKYCEAFNNKKVPVIRDVWDSIGREQCQRAVDESVQVFQDCVNAKVNDADTRAKLEGLLSTAFDAAMQRFNEVAVGDNTAAALKELRKQANTASANYRKTLQERLSNTAATMLQGINTAHINSIDHLNNAIASVSNSFTAKFGKDQETINAWNQELASRQLVWAREIYETLVQKWESAKQTSRELESANTETQKLKHQLQEMTDAHTAAQHGLSMLTQAHMESLSEVEQLRPAAAKVVEIEMKLANATAALAELKTVEEAHAELSGKVRTLLVQDEHQRAELGSQKELVQKYSAQIKTLEAQRQRQIDDAARDIEQLRMHMDAALDEVKDSKEAAVKRLQATQAELAAATQKLKEASAAQAQAATLHAEQQQRLKQELQTAKHQFDQTREELVAKFQHQLETTKAENVTWRQQRESELRLQMQKVESEKTNAERALQTTQTDLNSVRSALTAKTEEAASLKSELRSSQAKLSSLDTQLVSANARLEISEANVNKHRQTIETQENRLAAVEEDLRQIGQAHDAALLKLKFGYESEITRLEDALTGNGIPLPKKRSK